MTFQPIISLELKKTLAKIVKKSPDLAIATNKKIKQVCSCDEELINHYKNLRYSLADFKRVHVEKSFVLLFKIDFEKKIVLFTRLDHHDKIYK